MKIMSTLTMSASGQHAVVSQVAQTPNKDSKSLPSVTYDLSDGNTLVAVYCFIKNFIGASGSSTVAIDNKIEQAMDLVKSHLMFAVREEVEVLKERITELSDRINQLEHENSILRSHATQETLSQLCTAVSSKPPVSTGTSSNPATFDGRL